MRCVDIINRIYKTGMDMSIKSEQNLSFLDLYIYIEREIEIEKEINDRQVDR